MQQKIWRNLLIAPALGLAAFSAAAIGPSPHPADGPNPPPPPFEGVGIPGMRPAGGGPGDHRFGGPGLDHPGPGGEVIHTAMEIEQLYRQEGKPREVIGLYQELLNKTQDPMVRNFAYNALAKAQSAPADPDKAIATLHQSLEENLQRLNAEKPEPAVAKAP
jgi:hypothetical protein